MSKWARGSRKTAALLAACTVTAGNSDLTAPATSEKRSSCSSKNSESGSSAVAKWVQTPASSRCGSSAQARARATTAAGVAVAEPAHAAVVLDVEARRPALGTGAARRHRAELLVPDRHLRARGERHVELLLGQRAHRQQRHVREAAPDLGGLAAGRDRQPGGAAGERGGRAGVGAVAVAVGLDHRAELDPLAHGRVEVGAVALDGAGVDPGYSPLHGYPSTSAASASARVTMPARRPSPSTTGR